MPAVLYKPENIATVAALAASRRISLFFSGNSNTLLGGHGWDDGITLALANRVGLWATSILSPMENMNYGSGVGIGYGRLSTAAIPVDPSTAMTGTASVTAGEFAVTGLGTAFTTEIAVNQLIEVGTAIRRVVAIASDTELTVHRPWPSNQSGAAIRCRPLIPDAVARYMRAADAQDRCCGVNVYPVYLADGVTRTGNDVLLGVNISANSLLNPKSALIGDLWTVTFDSGSGSLRPAWRLNASPYTKLAEAAAYTTNTGTLGTLVRLTSQLTADTNRTAGVAFFAAIGTTLAGPLAITYCRVSDPAITAGACLNTVGYRGGKDFAVQVADVVGWSDETLDHILSAGCDRQNGDPMALWIWQEGLNSRATLTPAQYVEQIETGMARVAARWAALGYPAANLKFLAMLDHQPSATPDANLVAFSAALKTLADSRTDLAVAPVNEWTTFNGLMTASGYAPGPDVNHLTQEAYRMLGAMLVDAIFAHAAQLAIDQAAVAPFADKILRGNTILGTAGTLTKPSVGPTTIGIG